MRILVTNDDGIHAAGLTCCETIARQFSQDVWVIAPETDQSGVSHALSLNDPLRLRQTGERRYAVKGTPTDCVILAVRHLMTHQRPSLLLSGVNRGQNVAEDVTYSGTIAAAMEGTLLGIPSLALSQAFDFHGKQEPDYSAALHHAPAVITALLKEGIPAMSLVNINFPATSASQVAGLAVTTQGTRNQEVIDIDSRLDGRGNPYHWISFLREMPDLRPGTDLLALSQNKISITPLRLDLTDEPYMTRLAQIFD